MSNSWLPDEYVQKMESITHIAICDSLTGYTEYWVLGDSNSLQLLSVRLSSGQSGSYLVSVFNSSNANPTYFTFASSELEQAFDCFSNYALLLILSTFN